MAGTYRVPPKGAPLNPVYPQAMQAIDTTDPAKKPVKIKHSAPNPKVPAAALGGSSLALIVLWITDQLGLKMDTETALAFAGVLTFVVGYYTPGRSE